MTNDYWEARYRAGGRSGAGSTGTLAQYKASFLNRFVRGQQITSVVEFGCGDGDQLSLAVYPSYVGYDVSSSAIDLCRQKFANDHSKRFQMINERRGGGEADLSLSLDVICHLLEDDTYEAYLRALFEAATRFVIIYGNGCVRPYGAAHIRLRDFNADIARWIKGWSLVSVERNPNYSEIGTDPKSTWCNFHVYARETAVVHPVFLPQMSIRGLLPRSENDDHFNISRLTATARRALFLGSVASRLVAKILTERPQLTACLAPCHLDDAIGRPIDQDLALVRERVRTTAVASLSELIDGFDDNDGRSFDFDFVYVAADAASQLRQLGRLRHRQFSHTLILVIEKNEFSQQIIDWLTSNSFFQEIVPPLFGLRGDANRLNWYGAIVPEPRVVVSLTTIHDRLSYVEKVIESVLNQSYQADRIILNISEQPFLMDEGISRKIIPHSLLRLEEQGFLEITEVPNTGPYRKLLPTLKRFWDANCVIVTCDDDTVYPEHWLKGLVDAYSQHRSVVAYRCSYLRISDGKPLPYKDWVAPLSPRERHDEDYLSLIRFPTGKDGVLYSPQFFTPDIFDGELQKLAPTADDLVFKLGTLMTGTPVVQVAVWKAGAGDIAEFPHVHVFQQNLWNINNQRNDDALSKLINYISQSKKFDLSQMTIS